ncbi:hypothetical protein EJ06DRAFT_536124 [Trichodelitschia bisporula]|uniref:TPR domain-containing protein n=1 Tax=Trichodelitschia bisporula TaxID=703511 RepID=A0A6G1I642_9PEZI|nr:hypothetical protein EJ06DRAFT_536124 [Trichodelitschia bisporula]
MLPRTVSGAAFRASQCLAKRSPHPQMMRLVLHSPSRSLSQTTMRRRQKYTITVGQVRKGTKWEQFKGTFKQHPVYSTLAVSIIVSMLAMLGYANYVYITYIQGSFSAFPEPVAKPLRRALYYTNITPDPQRALKYYKEAMAAAEEVRMDPFSDEVLGLRIQIAYFLEKNHNHALAARVLEGVMEACMAWVAREGDKHVTDGQRSRVLGKTVGIGVKLGELYSNPFVDDQEAAEVALVGAVETVLREKQRREKEGVKEGEGDWMSDEEIGGALESLGEHYQAAKKPQLATPLFLQALTLCPPKSCHAAILMNNLAAALSGLPQPSQTQALTPGSPKEPQNIDFTSQATLWARKAITLASSIAPPERTEECDMACVAATCNLAEFAELQGRPDEALKLWREAESLAKAIGYEQGLNMCNEALTRLAGNANIEHCS